MTKDELADKAINDWMLPNGVTPGLTGYEDCCPEIPKEVIDRQLSLEKKLGKDWYKK